MVLYYVQEVRKLSQHITQTLKGLVDNMMLEETNDRLKKSKITEEQLGGINSLYILLDLDKDDFCKIVDAVGIETLLKKQSHYERLDQAEQELTAKERYLKAKNRLNELEAEKQDLENIVNSYKSIK